MKLDGKRALVTGSNQGIGQAIALRFAEEGADVAINYRKGREGAEDTCRQIQKMGRRTVAIQADVAVVADAQRVVTDAIAALGSLDILVNNAGVEKNAAFADVTEQDYRSVIDVNMTGPFFSTRRSRATAAREDPAAASSISAPCTKSCHSRISPPIACLRAD